MASVLVPVAYLAVLVTALLVFSHFYRKRLASQPLEPYFPSHPERNAYVTLLQKTDPPTPEVILKSALVRRAMADVQRVLRIREDKPALQNLLQKGSIGDELWNSLLAAEKELEGEIVEVVNEANSFVEGWGPVIFQTANEMLANEKMRQIFESTAERKAELAAKYGLKLETPSPETLIQVQTQAQASTPPTPSRAAAELTNTLSPSVRAGVESAASSDAESQKGSSPRSKAAKKGGKRK
ncbi:Translocation protein S66 [Marasmius tenuissimus]|uniref:Translocation protein S66 n=1 Tax=Marasmius tenuissimus TaxID=585030 RepID=A0ABR3ADQ7_9AGAR|nr:Translocation protein S66 [Marasmius tenuissimus]